MALFSYLSLLKHSFCSSSKDYCTITMNFFLVEEYVSQDRRMGRITKHFPVNFSLVRAVTILIQPLLLVGFFFWFTGFEVTLSHKMPLLWIYPKIWYNFCVSKIFHVSIMGSLRHINNIHSLNGARVKTYFVS